MFYLINQQFKRISVGVIQTPVTAKYGLPCSRYLVSSKRISADVLLVSSQDTLSSRPFLHIVWPRLLTCALQISRHISRLVPQSAACKGIQWICKGASHISLSSGACWTLLGHVTQHASLLSILHFICLAAQRNSQSTLYVVWPRYTRLFHSNYFVCRPVTSHNTPSFCCLVTPLIPLSFRACCSLFVCVTQYSLSQRVLCDRTTQQPWIIIHWN